MGKLIAVCGSAGSGKTTFSVKFAETLYHRSHGKHSVIALFCDIVTPSIPVIFPNRREEDLFSVGSVLSKTDFYADDVVSHMMMTKDRMNLGYLGYLSGENKNSFPEYKDVRAKNFLARKTAELYPDDYAVNGEAWERVQPKDLTAAEIGVKLGSTWVPTEDIEAFVHELLGTSYYARRKIKVKYIPHTAQWVIS